jgi:hypothetical protein
MAVGVSGKPKLSCCTPSMENVRMVLMYNAAIVFAATALTS